MLINCSVGQCNVKEQYNYNYFVDFVVAMEIYFIGHIHRICSSKHTVHFQWSPIDGVCHRER